MAVMEGLIRAMMDMIASKVCGKAIDKSKYEFTYVAVQTLKSP